jgi:hypothetical protein
MTALLAVTTCFLLVIALIINSLATSTPPISSTTTSISCFITSKISLSILVLPGLHFGLSLLAPITSIAKLTPPFN